MAELDPEAVRALRDKYREIKRLRDEDAAGRTVDPRADMLALARRFPGALRELDELPMDELERRLSALERLIAHGAPAPPWVALQIDYHGWMRAVLRIKRIAAGRRAAEADRVLHELATSYCPERDEPPLAAFDRAALAAILEPPEGRLNPWVFERVAREHGVDAHAVRRALFIR